MTGTVAAGLPAGRQVEQVLGEMGIPKDSSARRQQFERVMEERRAQDQSEEYGRIGRGWFWGAEAFRKELLAQVEARRGASHYGAELQESATEEAERQAREGIQELAWTEAELARRPKGDAAKVKLAVKLRVETTMALKRMAARLQMGTGASFSNLLSAQGRGGDRVNVWDCPPIPRSCTSTAIPRR